MLILIKDPRFNSAIDKQTGYTTHSIVCMPIKNHDDQVRKMFLIKVSVK